MLSSFGVRRATTWPLARQRRRLPPAFAGHLDGSSSPILLITVHGDKKGGATRNALRRYRLQEDGNILSATQLSELSVCLSDGTDALRMPRGLALLGGDTLLLASAAHVDASPGDSPLKGCVFAASAGAATAHRTSEVQAWMLASDGMHHPYGVAVAGHTVFASQQGSGKLLCFDASPAAVRPLVPATQVAQLPLSQASNGVRGVAVSHSGRHALVACKDQSAVFILDAVSGEHVGKICVPGPIALLWLHADGQKGLLIGSDDPEAEGVVTAYFWDASSKKLATKYAHCDGGGHAAGMAMIGGTLLVLGQETGAVHQFCLRRGEYLGTLLTGLLRPEAMLVVGM